MLNENHESAVLELMALGYALDSASLHRLLVTFHILDLDYCYCPDIRVLSLPIDYEEATCKKMAKQQ